MRSSGATVGRSAAAGAPSSVDTQLHPIGREAGTGGCGTVRVESSDGSRPRRATSDTADASFDCAEPEGSPPCAGVNPSARGAPSSSRRLAFGDGDAEQALLEGANLVPQRRSALE